VPSPPKLGTALPRIALPATTGEEICLAEMPGRSVLIVYPWTGRPGHPNPPNWDDIEGAHGSTPELEGFRDLSPDFAALKVGLFGFTEVRTTAGIIAALIDVAIFTVLAAGMISGLGLGRRLLPAVGAVSAIAPKLAMSRRWSGPSRTA